MGFLKLMSLPESTSSSALQRSVCELQRNSFHDVCQCVCVCVFRLSRGKGIFLSESRRVFLGGGAGMDGWTEAAGVEEQQQQGERLSHDSEPI